MSTVHIMNTTITNLFNSTLPLIILWPLSSLSHAITIVQSSDANALADSLVGGNITRIGPATLIGTEVQQGFFNNGTSTIGIDSGLVLSTGNVSDLPGLNSNGDLPETRSQGGMLDDVNTDIGIPGDTALESLNGDNPTFDANIMEFNFMFGDGSQGGDLTFHFVFGSEEYIDFIDSPFNDVFGFFVDGVNVAMVPGTSSPISVNSINDVANSDFYRNNVANTNNIQDLGLNIALDGLTTVITASAPSLSPGIHVMKFAIADTSDGNLDAAVFIERGSFTNEIQALSPSLETLETSTSTFFVTISEPSPLSAFGFGLMWLIRHNKIENVCN